MSEDIEQLVAEVERRTAVVRASVQARGAASHRLPIPHNLGVVVVSGYGELRSVEINTAAARHGSEEALAAAVRDAILSAEREVAAHYETGAPMRDAATADVGPRDEESWEDHDWV